MNTRDMTIDMTREALFIVERGSVVYDTMTDRSDKDILAVVPDKYDMFLSNYENGIFEAVDVGAFFPENEDWEFVGLSNFTRMSKENTVLAMETLCTPPEHVIYYGLDRWGIWVNNVLPLNKWQIRQQFSATASNSWAKAHKKMTVEKDLDMYRGKKSLFHSLRILKFGVQLCDKGYIYDFKAARDLWFEIYNMPDDTPWETYKEKYRPLYNSFRSELAVLAPKPVNNEKR